MNRDSVEKSIENPTLNSKKKHGADIILVAIILVVVLMLILMSQRTCTVILTVPEGVDEGYLWCEIYNDREVVICSDTGHVSQKEYAVKYRAVGGKGETLVIFAYIDPETGDEMAERVAYRITSTALGFLTATPVDVPKELEEETLPDLGLWET